MREIKSREAGVMGKVEFEVTVTVEGLKALVKKIYAVCDEPRIKIKWVEPQTVKNINFSETLNHVQNLLVNSCTESSLKRGM